MLTSMVPSPYLAAAAFSGSPDQKKFAQEIPGWKVFDQTNPTEFRLRSPIFFAASIRCPLFLFAGDQEDWCIPDNRQLASNARYFGKKCEFTTVPGDHLTSKPLAIKESLARFGVVSSESATHAK